MHDISIFLAFGSSRKLTPKSRSCRTGHAGNGMQQARKIAYGAHKRTGQLASF